MLAKLTFGRGSVVVSRVTLLPAPGIGDIEVRAAEGNLWTGDVHLMAREFKFHFGNVTKIETCPGEFLWCDDQPWKLLWEFVRPFTYEKYETAAALLLNALRG